MRKWPRTPGEKMTRKERAKSAQRGTVTLEKPSN